jgi:hypothetical protein
MWSAWRFWSLLQRGSDLQFYRVSKARPVVLDLFPRVNDVKPVHGVLDTVDLPFRVPLRGMTGGFADLDPDGGR